MTDMVSASKTASRIGEKLVEILDVFDLSFFMAGVVAVGALLAVLLPSPGPFLEHVGLAVFGVVLGCYILGLVCFAVGRWIRSTAIISQLLQAERSSDLILMALKQQALVPAETPASRPMPRPAPSSAPSSAAPASPEPPYLMLERYFGCPSEQARDPENGSARLALYTRMWVHVRSYPELTESFSLLKRYWILAASYDGIAVATLLWLLPVWSSTTEWPPGLLPYGPPLASLGLVVASLFCWHRAIQYKHYQIEELVATVAHWLTLVGRPVLAEVEAGVAGRGAAATGDDAA